LRYNVLESPDKTSFTLTASQVIHQRFELFNINTGKIFQPAFRKVKAIKLNQYSSQG
jgi:hypothetical protein